MLALALLLQAGPDSGLVAAALRAETAGDTVLAAAYDARQWRPAWFVEGRPTAGAFALRLVLARAADRGLDPYRYPSAGVSPEELAVAERNADWLAGLDVALSRDALAMASALAIGRVDPVTIMPAARIAPGRRFAPAAVLDRILAAADPVAVLDSLEPHDGRYRLLRDALPGLRVGADRVPPFSMALLPDVLHPGERFDGATALAAHLARLGDLAATAAVDTSYDGALVEAVRRFQARHGLDPDGVVGPATRAALATPLAWRLRQAELALERWRWFGDPVPGPLVEVDVAAATLRHHDPNHPDADLESRVIVGNPDWPTPVLESRIIRVVIHPEWIVPTSIARGELLPEFRADSTLFERDGYELRRGSDVVPPTPENFAAVGQGVTLRQRPGPRNALGRIKLEIAGTSAIHLHDTPGRRLFDTANRWLSHGCIRVEQIEPLARRLLDGELRWSPEQVTAALADTVTVAIALTRPVSVRLRYATAAVDEAGSVIFRPDRYDRDRRLDAALRAASP